MPLKQGTYVYGASSNKLALVSTNDIRAFGGTQAFATNAPVILIFVADLSKMGNGSDEAKKNTANHQNEETFLGDEGAAANSRTLSGPFPT
jgi:hypothetical protein